MSDNKIEKKSFEEICKDIGLNHFKEFASIIYSFAKDNFDKFCALFAAITIIISWVIRTMGYCYQAGRFSLYEIDKKYIEIDDNFLFQLIEYVAITIIFLLINYLFIFFSIQDDGTRFNIKRKCNVILLLLVEMFGLFFIVLISAYSSISTAIEELKNTNLISFIFIMIVLFLTALIINIFGIEFSLAYRKSRNKKNTKTIEESKTKKQDKTKSQFLLYVVTTFIVTSILITFSYLGGKFEEAQRTSFKIIEERVSEDSTSNTEKSNYIFSYDAKKYIYYPIIYENEDIYIISRLRTTSDNITVVDYSYQKIIAKEDVVTYRCDNIHSINSK